MLVLAWVFRHGVYDCVSGLFDFSPTQITSQHATLHPIAPHRITHHHTPSHHTPHHAHPTTPHLTAGAFDSAQGIYGRSERAAAVVVHTIAAASYPGGAWAAGIRADGWDKGGWMYYLSGERQKEIKACSSVCGMYRDNMSDGVNVFPVTYLHFFAGK